MSTGIGRTGRRALALASLTFMVFGTSCDLAGDEGGPGDGPGLIGSLPAPPGSAPAALQTLRASVGESVEPNGQSFDCSMSQDGRFVAFASAASNLVTADTNGLFDIFVLDRDFDDNDVLDEPGTLAITRVSVSDIGAQALGGSCNTPSISADGKFVAFQSNATNLIAGGSTGSQIFVRNRDPLDDGFDGADGTTLLVSRATGALGAIGNSSSFSPAISGDGDRVVFESNANNLAVDGNGFTQDVFMRAVGSFTTTKVSVEAAAIAGFPFGPDNVIDGDAASSSSFDSTISADGQWIAYSSVASDIVYGDTNGQQDIFLRDMNNLAAPTLRVSLTDAEVQANGFCARPSVAVNGLGEILVAFDSGASGMAAGDPDFNLDCFVRNVTLGTTTLVSQTTGGLKGNNQGAVCTFSADGNFIAFCSSATNMDPRHTVAFFQVYLRDLANGTTDLASVSTSGNAGNSTSVIISNFFYGLSGDGSSVTFGSFASNLVDDDFNPNADIFLRTFGDGVTSRVSERPGNEVNAACTENSLAANGQFVAFTSTANNLLTLPGGVVANGLPQVYVRDAVGDVTRLVSVGWTAGDFGDDASQGPSVSADGRFIAFDSFANNLVQNDPVNGVLDVFMYDLASGEMIYISKDFAGGTFSDGDSQRASVSSTGQFVAFDSGASFLITDDFNGLLDVFVRNIVTGVTTRVSVDSAGTESGGHSFNASISGNGRFVAFESDSNTLLGAGFDNNGVRDIFLHDRDVSGDGVFDEPGDIATTRVSVGPSGAEATGPSFNGVISADGNIIAFESDATDLVAADGNGARDVFVHNRLTGVTTRISVDQAGLEANGNSLQPSISGDGRYVAFTADATNLIAGTPTTGTQVFRKDRTTNEVTLVSTATSEGNNVSQNPSISSNGRFVSFDSAATNLTPPDTNLVTDVLLRGPLP